VVYLAAGGLCAPVTANCVAFLTDGSGSELTKDSGRSWKFVPLGQAGQPVAGRDCPSATRCYELGSNRATNKAAFARTVDAGTNWEQLL
jgi:hypothetical protein